MDATSAPKVTVVQPGTGEGIAIPGFGCVYKLYSRDNGGEVAIVEHPFAVGLVLGPGGYITKPRGQVHAMWNAGKVPGRIVEVITPGGFESYFRELGELLTASQAGPGGHPPQHESDAFGQLADKYHISYGTPPWLDDVVARYGLNPPTH